MINGNNSYWQNASMNIRKDEDEWRLAKDTVPAPSELGSKDITENGNYLAKDDGLDGYSSVTVNVPSAPTPETFEVEMVLTPTSQSGGTIETTKTFQETLSAINDGKLLSFTITIDNSETDVISYGYRKIEGEDIVYISLNLPSRTLTMLIMWGGDRATFGFVQITGLAI